jgi:hypothetical protein
LSLLRRKEEGEGEGEKEKERRGGKLIKNKKDTKAHGVAQIQ